MSKLPLLRASLLAFLILAYAIIVPLVFHRDQAAVDFAAAFAPPSLEHPFGTDSGGRDLFIRTAQALRISLLIASTTAIFSALVGSVIGVSSALIGGFFDRLVMRLVDGLNSLPHLILGLVIVSLFKGSIPAIVFSLVLTHWIPVCRVTRAEVMSIRRADFVSAAYLGGRGHAWVIWRHFVPASLGQGMVGVILLLPHAIWHESTLSFLGVGLPAHRASLGTLLSDAQGGLLLGAWWILVFPTFFLVAFALSVSRIGEGIVAQVNRFDSRQGQV